MMSLSGSSLDRAEEGRPRLRLRGGPGDSESAVSAGVSHFPLKRTAFCCCIRFMSIALHMCPVRLELNSVSIDLRRYLCCWML